VIGHVGESELVRTISASLIVLDTYFAAGSSSIIAAA
jgi:hypothetical protein